jgi:pimeloyl-ACP methyl ester carboxylesterase
MIPLKPGASQFHTIRNLRYHVRCWGDAGAPKIFLLHGWMDVSASFQFLVDCFARDWHVIAPDWRGFGLTEWARDGYWFPDYYADLDALLAIFQPDEPINLIGHSMGGNIACTYAGVRPQRVAKLVSLEGFGASRTQADEAPKRYARWLDQLVAPLAFKPYPSFDAVAARMQKNNPRLTDAHAQFLAQHWARKTEIGTVELRSDPKHKIVNPVLSRMEELQACWRQITAPVLWVRGDASGAPGWRNDDESQFAERKSAFSNLHEVTIAECGHMLHHDQPQRLAKTVEDFMSPDCA